MARSLLAHGVEPAEVRIVGDAPAELERALREGLHIVPDGRMYVSTAHTSRDIEETLSRMEAVFSDLS